MAKKNEVYQLSLDIRDYVKALADAVKAFSRFEQEIGKQISLRVNIDQDSINRMAQAMGRGVKTAVDESTKVATQAAQKSMQGVVAETTKASQQIAAVTKKSHQEILKEAEKIAAERRSIAAKTVKDHESAEDKILAATKAKLASVQKEVEKADKLYASIRKKRDLEASRQAGLPEDKQNNSKWAELLSQEQAAKQVKFARLIEGDEIRKQLEAQEQAQILAKSKDRIESVAKARTAAYAEEKRRNTEHAAQVKQIALELEQAQIASIDRVSEANQKAHAEERAANTKLSAERAKQADQTVKENEKAALKVRAVWTNALGDDVFDQISPKIAAKARRMARDLETKLRVAGVDPRNVQRTLRAQGGYDPFKIDDDGKYAIEPSALLAKVGENNKGKAKYDIDTMRVGDFRDSIRLAGENQKAHELSTKAILKNEQDAYTKTKSLLNELARENKAAADKKLEHVNRVHKAEVAAYEENKNLANKEKTTAEKHLQNLAAWRSGYNKAERAAYAYDSRRDKAISDKAMSIGRSEVSAYAEDRNRVMDAEKEQAAIELAARSRINSVQKAEVQAYAEAKRRRDEFYRAEVAAYDILKNRIDDVRKAEVSAYAEQKRRTAKLEKAEVSAYGTEKNRVTSVQKSEVDAYKERDARLKNQRDTWMRAVDIVKDVNARVQAAGGVSDFIKQEDIVELDQYTGKLRILSDVVKQAQRDMRAMERAKSRDLQGALYGDEAIRRADKAAFVTNARYQDAGINRTVKRDQFIEQNAVSGDLQFSFLKEAEARVAATREINASRLAQRQLNKDMAQSEKLVTGFGRGWKDTGTQIAESAVRLAKFYLIFRGVGEAFRLVERSVSAVIRGGLEFIRISELQRLGVQGILAENYKVIDAYGDTVKPAESLALLQTQARKEWERMQESALAVVGTTEDLMSLYVGILPHAAKLEQSTEAVQDMVKSTAIAASLMDISFQDARSAIVSLLQGRNLQRNRLVSALGIDASTLKELKGTPQLFLEVQKRLDSFMVMAPQAEQTFGALSETFRDLVARVGEAFSQPLVDLFREIMIGAKGAAGGKGLIEMLFGDRKQNEGIRLLDEVRARFALIKTAMTDAMTPVREFWRELTGEGAGDAIDQTVLGFATIFKSAMTLLVWFTKLTLVVTQWVSVNTTLIKGILLLAVTLAGGRWLMQFGNGVQSVIASLNAMRAATIANAAAAAAAKTPVLSGAGAINMTAVSATKASSAMTVLGGAVGTLATGIVAGGIIAALSMVIAKLTQIYEQASRAKTAMNLLLPGASLDEIDQALLEDTGRLTSQDPEVRSAAGRNFGTSARRRSEESATVTFEQFKKVNDKFRATYARINDAASKDEKAAISMEGEALRIERDRMLAIVNRSAEGIIGDVANLEANIRTSKRILEGLKPTILIETDSEGNTTDATSAVFEKKKKQTLDNIAQGERDLAYIKRLAAEANVKRQEFEKEVSPTQLIANEWSGGDDGDGKKGPGFKTNLDEKLKDIEDFFAMQSKILDIWRSNNLIGEARFDEEMERLEAARLEAVKANLDAQLVELDEFYKKKSVKLKDDPETDDEIQYAQLRQGIANQQTSTTREIQVNVERRTSRVERLGNEGNELANEAREGLLGFVSDVFGGAEEEVDRQIDKLIDKFTDEAKKKGQENNPNVVSALKEIDAIRGIAKARKALEVEMKTWETAYGNLRQEEDLLTETHERGILSTDKYTKALAINRQAQMANLQARKDALQRQDDQLVALQDDGKGIRAGERERITQEIRDLTMEQMALLQRIPTAVEAFGKLGSFVSGLATGMAEVFEPFSQGAADALRMVDAMISKWQSFMGLITQFRDVQATFAASRMGMPGGGGGATAGLVGGSVPFLASMFGNGNTSSLGGDSIAFARGIPSIGSGAVQSSGSGGNLFTGGSGAGLAAATFGISAAITIGVMMYQKSVEKATKRVEDGFKKISEALNSGAATLGESLQSLEAERKLQEEKLRGSKSGRKALKESQDEYEQMVEDLKRQMKSVRDSFDETLKGLRAGTDVFGDFARELFNLEKQAKEYMDTFTFGTPEYEAALGKVTELFTLSLQNLKANMEESMLGYEGDAIGSVERYLDLMKTEAGLQKQLSQLDRERRDLAESKEDLVLAKREAALQEIEDKEKLLQLELRISEIIRSSIEEEAAVRRRGLVDAQLSVAQQKAIEISRIRERSRKELDQARKDLERGRIENQQSMKDRERSLRDQEESIADREVSLVEEDTELREELELTRIRLNGARQVADIEGAVFGLSRNRFDLERRRQELEVKTATLQVKKWEQTKMLIDSIMASGGELFVPPPGFPQVRVQIGNIVIDNRSNSVSTTSPGTTPAPSNPNAPGGPFYPPYDPNNPANGGYDPNGNYIPGVPYGDDIRSSLPNSDIYNTLRRQGYGI
jgi:hypothetical protein